MAERCCHSALFSYDSQLLRSSRTEMIRHPSFQSRADAGQFAMNGDWAHAWELSPNDLPNDALIAEYLSGSGEVAFDALFGSAFFGARFVGTPEHVLACAQRCVAAMRMSADGAAFLPSFVDSFGLSGIGKRMVHAEIGAVNDWHTNGPIIIDPPAQAPDLFDALWASISASPLAINTVNRKAIELTYETPFVHWFALPVSPPSDAAHRFSESLLRSAYEYAEGSR